MGLSHVTRSVAAAIGTAWGRPLSEEEFGRLWATVLASHLTRRHAHEFAFLTAWFDLVAAGQPRERLFVMQYHGVGLEAINYLLDDAVPRAGLTIDFRDEADEWEWHLPAVGLVAGASWYFVGWLRPDCNQNPWLRKERRRLDAGGELDRLV